MAIIATTYDKQGKNKSAYESWRRRITREINKLNGIQQATLWDAMAKTRKSIKR